MEQEVIKKSIRNIFIFVQNGYNFLGGYNLGSEKQFMTIKFSYCIKRPGSWGSMAVNGNSFPSWKADLYDVISLKIEQLFI